MFKWIDSAIWAAARLLGYGMQLVGLTGILFFIIMGLWALAGRIERM